MGYFMMLSNCNQRGDVVLNLDKMLVTEINSAITQSTRILCNYNFKVPIDAGYIITNIKRN